MFLLSANVDLINFAVQKIVIHTGFFGLHGVIYIHLAKIMALSIIFNYFPLQNCSPMMNDCPINRRIDWMMKRNWVKLN